MNDNTRPLYQWPSEYTVKFKFPTSNNEAKYEALVIDLRMEKELRVRYLRVYSDSQLIVGQVRDQFEAKDLIIA